MLQRKNLDERCTLNEPSRVANEGCDQLIESDIQVSRDPNISTPSHELQVSLRKKR